MFLEIIIVSLVSHMLISMYNYFMQREENKQLYNLYYEGRNRSRSDDNYLHTRINELEIALKELKK